MEFAKMIYNKGLSVGNTAETPNNKTLRNGHSVNKRLVI